MNNILATKVKKLFQNVALLQFCLCTFIIETAFLCVLFKYCKPKQKDGFILESEKYKVIVQNIKRWQKNLSRPRKMLFLVVAL